VNARFAFAATSTGTQAASAESVAAFTIDPTTGDLTANGAPTVVPPPSGANASLLGLTTDPNGKFLFVTNDRQLLTFSLGNGGLTQASSLALPVPATVSSNAFLNDVEVDAAGNFLYVVDEDGTNCVIHVLAIGAQGGLTETAGSPFPGLGVYSLCLSPAGGFAFGVTPSTSGMSPIQTFSIDPRTGAVASASTSTPGRFGWGPSTMVVDSAGKFLYLISTQNSIDVLGIGANGALTQVGSAPNPGNLNVTTASYLSIHPTGKFIFASFMGVVFPPPPAILLQQLGLPPGTGGAPPIPPAIVTYSVDPSTGLLTVNSSVAGVSNVAYPGLPVLDPAGKFLFVSNSGTSVSTFAVDGTTGALRASGSALAVQGVSSVAVSH
jgi:6-phosphogluconolactonase (cycloisomerase 2 family)